MTLMKSLEKISATNTQLIIFTDLDGTLLDHNSYSFDPAQKALNKIAELGIPLIINSSKTRAEIIAIQKKLKLCQPFISENGAAAYFPHGKAEDADLCVWQREDFAVTRSKVLAVLKRLRQQYDFNFQGFSDGSAETIAKLTGLSLEEATMAGDRDFSEPLQWQDSDAALETFLKQLETENLSAQQGGRFLTVMGNTANKGLAMQWLGQQYKDDRPMLTIALGDSPNDEPMLNAADIAVIIKSARSESIKIVGLQQTIRTELSGPAGWQWAMDQLLEA